MSKLLDMLKIVIFMAKYYYRRFCIWFSFDSIEEALGFKLYAWQRKYLLYMRYPNPMYRGKAEGKTTALILWLLLWGIPHKRHWQDNFNKYLSNTIYKSEIPQLATIENPHSKVDFTYHFCDIHRKLKDSGIEVIYIEYGR